MFHPQNPCLTKNTNTFIVKNLTLVLDQKKGIESNLQQEKLLKECGDMPSYMSHFEFKTRMQASLTFQRTSLVAVFVLADKVTEIMEDIEDIQEACDAAVIYDNHINATISGWGGEAVPHFLRPL